VTRRLAVVAALGLVAGISLGCGKYGSPRRIGEGPPPSAATATPTPAAPQGSSILPPTHSPKAAPGSAPEEPEEDQFP